MNREALQRFYGWINERHAIYLRRAAGESGPWTDDPILQKYKFTNPFRENDRVTVWMREHWTGPNADRPFGEIIFNCCLFRVFGTPEFAEDFGWTYDEDGWNPEAAKRLAAEKLKAKQKVFTGAYIITNQGLKMPKQDVVADLFLTPVWNAREEPANMAFVTRSLQETHKTLGRFQGWGGGGFMAYEVVTDLMYTPVLQGACDRYTWANAGPGAKRGLNRLFDRPLEKSIPAKQANEEMQLVHVLKVDYLEPHVSLVDVDMRTTEHSLCEWDKYERVRLGQGRPRSLFRPKENSVHGPVNE